MSIPYLVQLWNLHLCLEPSGKAQVQWGGGGEWDQVHIAVLPVRAEKKWNPKIAVPAELPTPQDPGERLPTSSWGLWWWPLPHHLPDSIAGATQSNDSKQCSHNPNQWTPGLCLQLPSYLHLGMYRGCT